MEFSEKQIKSVIYGVAVADALGAPFEFFTEEEMKIQPPIEMVGGESKLMKISPGEWTDDTEMTLMLAEALERGLPVDFEGLALSYIKWADGHPKDIGTTTNKALFGSSGFEESSARARDFYEKYKRSAGNGTIMRSAPLAFIPVSDRDLFDVVKKEAAITHGAPEAFEASYIQALLIRSLLRGDSFKIDLEGLSEKTKEALSNSSDRDFVLSQVSQGGSAWSSLAAGLWALSFESFKEGVREVIKLGYDTDTNAACAGALLAARDGYDTIPEEWISPLFEKKRIEAAIYGLSQIKAK